MMFGIMRSGRSSVCAMQTPTHCVGDIIICVCECVCVCVRMRFSVLGCAWERWHVCLVAGPRIAGDMTATRRRTTTPTSTPNVIIHLNFVRFRRQDIVQLIFGVPALGHLQLGHRFHFITTVPPPPPRNAHTFRSPLRMCHARLQRSIAKERRRRVMLRPVCQP